MTDLRRRLARLEDAGPARDPLRDGALVILPPGFAAEDADAFVAAHRDRTRWDGVVIVLPSNGRETPHSPHTEQEPRP